MNKPEDREGLFRTRRPGGGYLRHCGKSYPLCHSPSNSTETSKQGTGRMWIKLFTSTNSSKIHSNGAWTTRGSSNSWRRGKPGLSRSRPNQLSSGFTQFRHQKISCQESPLLTIPGSFQEKTRIQREKEDLFQPQVDRVRPNDPEYVSLCERSTQEPEIVVNSSRISSPTNRNIPPTKNEQNVVTPESNLNSDQLWLQMSQFSAQTQEKFDEHHRSNERLKELKSLYEAAIKAIQESCAKLHKASEETNKRLNQVFEEKYHCKRDRDCLDQDIKKLFNVCQNIKPQQQGHSLDNPYQEDIEEDLLLDNKPRSPSQYQDGDDMTCSQKEALRQITEASSRPKSSGVG
ncbi:hypothetical protein O181_053274 [Austropuccinia psidii MF-1]|uniref:Uncharacterized protein n=1 Tax=Austropuccinia psidii MF-1 TaxID=1389203 RepID=A0A9Q3E2C5_9BASI|nr:hypothetical protein [Austropuccinia psidii MF-1]